MLTNTTKNDNNHNLFQYTHTHTHAHAQNTVQCNDTSQVVVIYRYYVECTLGTKPHLILLTIYLSMNEGIIEYSCEHYMYVCIHTY